MKHTPPYYRAKMTGNGQGLIIDEKTGSNIAVVYDEDDTDEIVHAVNMHELLLATLKQAVESLDEFGCEDIVYYKDIIEKAERK